MNNRQKVIQLFDLYENLLTDKQKDYFSSYYFDDLSLSEIAQNFDVSRNAVHDHIKKTCNLLEYYEEKLVLKKKYDLLSMLLEINDIEEIKTNIKKIIEE